MNSLAVVVVDRVRVAEAEAAVNIVKPSIIRPHQAVLSHIVSAMAVQELLRPLMAALAEIRLSVQVQLLPKAAQVATALASAVREAPEGQAGPQTLMVAPEEAM